MLKKFLTIFVIAAMVMSMFAGCGNDTNTANTGTATDNGGSGDWKIGILTGTVSQNEEEYRAAQAVKEKYGEEHVIIMTYPDKFMDEQETTIANVASMAAEENMKALLLIQAVPGSSAAIDKAREINPDLLIIAGVPGENPADIASRADIVFTLDELTMGRTMVEQAAKQGAKVFVHYSFPRHMSYALLSARRDLLKENCEAMGIEFVDATALDPTGDAGLSGAQQFILEDTPRMIEKYGKDTAFFSTNCGLQIPLIKSVYEGGAIYPQPCCPSPYHGFPSALGIEIPEEKQGDIDYLVDEIKAKMAEKGMTGRMSTWPVPCSMMFIEAGADYAKGWIDGEFTEKLNKDKVEEYFKAYAGVDIELNVLEEEGVTYDNYLMVLLGYLDF
ncbi:MAG: DUF3798 domain-containing protein [Clostridia bacterium]|nr:DUF3798 domain-containing protein [Clostridia bacterium]